MTNQDLAKAAAKKIVKTYPSHLDFTNAIRNLASIIEATYQPVMEDSICKHCTNWDEENCRVPFGLCSVLDKVTLSDFGCRDFDKQLPGQSGDGGENKVK